MENSQKHKNRFIGLDALRGIAVLAVVLFHINPNQVPGMVKLEGAAGFIFWRFKYIGSLGVDLFFVLSGFLISGLIYKELEEKKAFHFKRFWLRRSFKILPSYFALLIILGLTGATAYITGNSLEEKAQSIIIHIFFLNNYIDPMMNMVTWSLAVEEHFYVLFPLLVLASGSKITDKQFIQTATLATLLFCFFSRIIHSHWQTAHWQHLTHNRIDCIMAGIYSQFLWRYQWSTIKSRLNKRMIIFSTIGILLVSPFTSKIHILNSLTMTALCICFAAVLLLTMKLNEEANMDRALTNSLAKIGQYSYNIYLWHVFIPLLGIPLYSFLTQTAGQLKIWPPFVLLLQASVFIFFSCITGMIMTYVIEKPFLRLREQFCKN